MTDVEWNALADIMQWTAIWILFSMVHKKGKP